MLTRRTWPAAVALAGASLLAAVAQAQTGSIDRCMTLSTEAARLGCMRAALERAESLLREAGIEAASETEPNVSPDHRSDSAASGLASLGAEQVSRPDDRPVETQQESRYRATIVNSRERLPGQLRFELDNGQIWQQTAADSQRLFLRAGEPVAVELWSSWSGGYRMLLSEQRQIVRVERVR